jgi:hypothetical protein
MKLIAALILLLGASISSQAKTLDLAPKKAVVPASADEVVIPNFEKVQKPDESKIPTECQAIHNGVCVKTPKDFKNIHPHGEHRPNGNLKLNE